MTISVSVVQPMVTRVRTTCIEHNATQDQSVFESPECHRWGKPWRAGLYSSLLQAPPTHPEMKATQIIQNHTHTLSIGYIMR